MILNRFLYQLPFLQSPSDFFFAVVGDLLSKEGCNVIRVNGENRRFNDLAVNRLKELSVQKHDIGRAFNLLDGPLVTQLKFIYYGAVSFGKNIQNMMKVFGVNSFGKLLSHLPVADLNERVIQSLVVNAFLLHFTGKPVVTVHIELKPERRPGWNTEITQAKIPINEIEIVMKTFTAIKLQKGSSALFVMPWFVAVARLHS